MSGNKISSVYRGIGAKTLLNAALAEAGITVVGQGAGIALATFGNGGGISFTKDTGVNANSFNA